MVLEGFESLILFIVSQSKINDVVAQPDCEALATKGHVILNTKLVFSDLSIELWAPS